MSMSPAFLAVLLLAVSSAVRGQSRVTCIQMLSAFPKCNCTNPNGLILDIHVDCSNRGLTAVPVPLTTLNYTIKMLYLNDNNITTLPRFAFRGMEVAAIDLRGNAIADVDVNAFEGLTDSLHTLYLQGDGMVHPPKEAFPTIRNLESLTLTDYNVSHLLYRPDDTRDRNLPHAVFLAFQHLKKLTLERWKLESIDPNGLTGPTALEEFTLTDNNLYSIPIDALRLVNTLLKVSITGNPNLVRVGRQSFGNLTSLQELDLSNNSLNDFHELALLGPNATLRTLKLSRNALSSTRGLHNLINIEEVDLSQNTDLTEVPYMANLSPQQPFSLNLSDCSIRFVQATAFTSVAAKLLSLDLSRNELQNINHDAFQGAMKLQYFAMSDQSGNHNAPFQIPSSLTSASQTLKSLKLNGQLMNQTSLWAVVPQLTQLEELDLKSTELSDLPPLALERLTQLKTLHLEYNQLRNVNQSALVGPRSSLKYLDLSGNFLSGLSSCVLHQYTLDPPLEMALGRNQWQCNCALRWLKTYSRDNKIKFNVGNEPICGDGQSLLEKSDAQLVCTQSYQEPSCTEHYVTTASPTDPTPTESPRAIVSLNSDTEDTITVSWNVPNPVNLEKIIVEVKDNQNQRVFYRSDISPDQTSIEVPSLQSGTFHTVCVTPVFPDSRKPVCSRVKTQGDTPSPAPGSQKGSSENVGIIVGAIVGSVLLVALLIAIIYLVFLRKKPKTPPPSTRHVQPRTFTKQELPTMAEPKDTMQVVAISDGMAHGSNGATKAGYSGPNGPGRVGRAHLLTSDGSSYKVMGDLTGSGSETYENDRGPLPNPPKSKPPPYAYYNDAFSKYDEINNEVSF